jgi:hypothetical protein
VKQDLAGNDSVSLVEVDNEEVFPVRILGKLQADVGLCV